MRDMDTKHLEIHSEIFDEIVEDIKQRNLSRNRMPKLIIGTGLSIVYGIPGMSALAEYLEKEIDRTEEVKLKEMWKAHCPVIKSEGLEAGLANLTEAEAVLVDAIKILTAKYILEGEEKLHKEVLEKNTGFSRLLNYLKGTVSAQNKVIDIMTPNYDRVIELVCDKQGIGVITGFCGSLYGRFHREVLKQPTVFYNCKGRTWVRLFKPHGSINWINENGNKYLTNDYDILQKKVEYIEIVTPGSSKYREGLTNNTFRCMREDFNEVLDSEEQYSLLLYGYGFNDAHFDTVIFGNFKRDVLILARDVKKEILNKALKRKNITVFYHEGNGDYMIYKSKKYHVDVPLWDIDQFAEVFLG